MKGGKQNKLEAAGDIGYVKNLLMGRGITLGEKINEGAFAVVRTAKNEVDGEEVAIKMVDRTKAPKDFLEKFFPKELEILKLINHDNVVGAKSILHAGWFTCIVMEKASIDLLGHIVKKGALKEAEARPMYVEILAGLKYLHGIQVAHRDLKCENILIDCNNVCKLADFGFARYCVNAETKARVLSETYCGSPAYAAPEILKGRAYNPLMSDVWSMGVVLYIMTNGIMPFDDSDNMRMLRNQIEKRWSWHPDLKGTFSVDIRRLIKSMLEPDLTMRATLVRVCKSPWVSGDGLFATVPMKKKLVNGTDINMLVSVN